MINVPKNKIGILIFDDFTDLDFFLSWDLLNRVRLLGLKEQWQVVIAGAAASHRSVSGLDIQTTAELEDLASCSAVLVCSGPKTRILAYDADFLARIKLDPSRQMVGSICSGALILAGLGLLKNRKATTYPTAANMLRSFEVDVVGDSFVIDGKIATAAACMAGQKLAYWFIEGLVGKNAVEAVDKSVRPLSGDQL